MSRHRIGFGQLILLVVLLGTAFGLVALTGGRSAGASPAAVAVVVSATTSPSGTVATGTATTTRTATGTPTRTRTATNTPTFTPTPGCNDWRYVDSPTSGQQVNTFYGMSAAGPDDVWAVGNKGQYSSVNLSVMIQHWDGTAWTLLPINTPGTLRGVDVISSNDIWAVGYTYDPPAQTMIMHWDGTAWNVVPSPSIAGTPNYLYGVAAAGPNDVWAVGEAADQALVLHWDGDDWTIVPTPDLEYSVLYGVDVAATNDVWAVGQHGSNGRWNLTLHWDGTEWTEVSSPSPGTWQNGLQSVSVVSSADIWAAGWSSNGNTTFSPTILHWDGTTWTESLVTLPGSPSTVRSSQLFGISAASSTEVYAVGWGWDSTIQVNILLEWNGTNWLNANPPRPSGYYSHLQAVTTVGAGEAWAVGVLGNGSSIYVPQVLRYGPPCGTPTATVTGTPPTATPTACGVAIGALTAGDLTLSSYLYRLFPANTCEAPQPYQGTAGPGGSYYYDTYTYPNTTGASTCVSILLNPMTCTGTGAPFIHASAYLNTFDPTDLETNYLGDIGNSPSGPTTFSVTVPAGQSVVVVINAVASGPNGACPGYQITVNGHGACPTPTPGTPTATPTCTPDRWATVAPIPGPRMGAAVAAVGGFLYEAGGDVSTQGGGSPELGTMPGAGIANKADSPDVRTTAAARYDGTSWAPIANLPVAVMDGAGVSDGTYFYVMGGSSNTTVVTNNQRYDPASNTWTARAPLPQAAAGAAPVFHNGRIYLFGGCNGGSCSVRLNTVYIYDPATNTWSTGAPVPTNAAFSTAEVIGSYIYLAGGVGNPGENKAYRYDPATNTWDDAAMADLPDSWWAAASGVLNGKMYVIGGIVNNASGASNRTIRYDPVTNTWTNDANLNTGTFRMQGDIYNNSLYIVGGSVWASYTARVERFTINTGCQTPPPGTMTATSTPTGTPGTPGTPSTGTPTAISTSIATTTAGQPSSTPAATNTSIPPTATVAASGTVPPTAQPCSMSYPDVPSSNAFYNQIMCLSCMGFVSGYSDGSFQPNSNITRGQLSKVVANTAGFSDAPNEQTFEDVAPGSTFYMYIERMAARGVLGGYACGGPGEPCGPERRPYFRPGANATRGQISKIVANAANLQDPVTTQTFEDVPSTHPFYEWIERLAQHDMMSGYLCGGPGEPCLSGKPYFRPGANATRGQLSKIAANGFYPDCTMR